MIADDRGSQIADDRKESCFHMIADDRKRSQSRLLHTFRTAEVSRKNSQQTKWRTSTEKFCCKQIYYSFSKPIMKFFWYISLRIQKVAFSIASDNDHTQFLCCGRLRRRWIKLSFPSVSLIVFVCEIFTVLNVLILTSSIIPRY